MNYVSGSFTPYSKRNSVNTTGRPHISLCLPQHHDYHKQQDHEQQNALNNSQGQMTLMLHRNDPISPRMSRDMALLGCAGCDQPSQCHTKKFMGDWRGLQPCPVCLLPVQPSRLPCSCLRLIEVMEWIQGEDLSKCLPRAKHHLQGQCRTGHQPLQVTVTGCSWLITDHGTWIQLLPSTHTTLPSIQNQQQEELTPIHLSLPTFPIPHHSLIQGRWGRGLIPPSSHPLQPHQWNTGKYRSTQNIGMKPRKYYSIPQIHFSYCLRWSLLLGYCDTVKFMGNRLTPSTPKRRGTINTSLFLILLPSAFGLFSSTFLLYPPIIGTAKYNQHLSFFSRQPLREQKASPGWTLAVPSSSSRLQCSAPQAEICCSH